MSKKLKQVKKILKKIAKKHKLCVEDVFCNYYDKELFFYDISKSYKFPQKWELLESYKV